jgi:gluconate 2-dehydrogenase gamma chain
MKQMNDAGDIKKRRGFLKQIVGVGGALPFTSALAAGAPAPATAPLPTAQLGYLCFSQDEAAFVEAMVTVMCPADDLSPNGVDAGLAVYMDRQLAGDFGRGWKRYSRGPWLQGKPQQGNQLPLSPQQWFKAGCEAASAACLAKYGKAIDQLSTDDANTFLIGMSAGKFTDGSLSVQAWFNDLIYPLFVQACFADPIYGGNVGKVFWKMIGYPGLPATHTLDMVQYRGKPFPGAKDPKSIADFS